MGRGPVYVEHPKSANITASEWTQEVLRVKCEFIIFWASFFGMYKQIVIASGSDNNYLSLRHPPRHFPEGDLVYFIVALSRWHAV